MTQYYGLGTYVPVQTQNTTYAHPTNPGYPVGGTLSNGITVGLVSGHPTPQHQVGGTYGCPHLPHQVGALGHNGLPHGHGSYTPALATELSETNNDYILTFDVPGMEAHDLEVTLSGNTFHLNGTRNESHEAKATAYSEITKGCISRSITVPFDVASHKTINTSLENGVLKIRIAKENQCGTKANSRKIKIG